MTQNRGAEFGHVNGDAEVWSSMLGDPTLRMHVVKPPTNVRTDAANVLWNDSPDLAAVSYIVYRAPINQIPGTVAFERIGSIEAAAPSSFRDPSGSTSGFQYMVRAVKREDGPSGAYYNLSQGGVFQRRSRQSAALSEDDFTSVLSANALPASDPASNVGVN